MEPPAESSRLLNRTTQALAAIAIVLLTPFSINNFVQGRYLLGVGSLAIVAILGLNSYTLRRGRH